MSMWQEFKDSGLPVSEFIAQWRQANLERTMDHMDALLTTRYYSVRNGRGCGHIHKNWQSAMKCDNYSPRDSRLVKYNGAQDPRY